ncbi:MAG TPA: cbb3-type cytochrome oxidase assembly protein CcoS [Rhodobacteraceae bacterium]|jgi:cbb3-type cytochrome oxidase maturation protein|nr:cbb3-type cytochrome oxidase assembly protein CcoS [Paracoccaceae bacterium]
MEVLAYLIPISLILGSVGLIGFLYTVKSNQYDDPEGDARRILSDQYDDKPKPD